MPSAFGDDIIGHAHVVRMLERWAKAPSFAYLFSGPAHLGKRTLAERFVRLLSECPPDRALVAHPDVVTFELEEGKKEIAVKTVRELRARLYEKPQTAPRVVAFIPRMDRLNEEGFNALLKVMEEPPASVVFVAVVENVSRVPATILSRMVQIPLGLVPQSQILAALAARGLKPDEALERAAAARGRPGLALDAADPLAPYRAAADAYAAGPNAGQRMAAAESLRVACESADDAYAAWRDALQACAQAVRARFVAVSRAEVALGQGIADATAFIGGPVTPRLFLDAASVQTERGRAPLPGIFPKTFPLSLQICPSILLRA